MGDIKKMFNPRSVALFGATDKEESVGRALLENLKLAKNCRIFPVNPQRKNVLNVPCYSKLVDIQDTIDLAVVATPANTVPQIAEECGKKNIEGIIIISAGFREIGEAGQRLEKQLKETKQKYGMRILGPNCLGIIKPNIGLNATFMKTYPQPGKIALVSQSGALGSAVLDRAVKAKIGFSMFASLGSMVDIDFGDMIDYLGDTTDTRSIIIYMESVENAKNFISAAKHFARTKPIIVIKSGRYAEGKKAAQSHTGAMAGDDSAYDAAFKRAGIVRVKEIADVFHVAEVLDSKYLPKGSRLTIVTNAGGPGALATDALIEHGGTIAPLSEKCFQKLDSFLPAFWSRGNPVDVLGDADVERYTRAINLCLEDDNDGVLVIYTPQATADPEELARAVSKVAQQASKPTLTAFMGGEKVEKSRNIFISKGIPTFETPEEAIKAYQYMHMYSRNLELLYETPADLPVDSAPPKNNLKALIKRIARDGRNILTEEESKRFLINYNIETTDPVIARNLDEAIGAAEKITYPVVIKIVSPDIIHKSDAGGVIIGIDSRQKLTDSYDMMITTMKERLPDAKIEGVSIQKMIQDIDYELILGAKKDREFGSVILFGLGGVTTELYKDFAIGLPPLNQILARRLMEETKAYKMIQGYRGKTPADIRQLEQLIVSFSNLIVDFPEIAEMDINPVAITKGKAYAIDARIIIDTSALDSPTQYPHLVITPYPTRYVMPWRLNDGTDVLLRPIKPEDEPLESEMLKSLSDASMKQRFFEYIRNITHEMLTRFCNINYEREMAIVAELQTKKGRKLIGIGRLINETDNKSGEFAVVVQDDYQGKGLGYKLIDILIGIGAEKGLEKIYGTVLTSNTGMIKLCEKLGFTIVREPDGNSRVELTLK